MAFDLPLRCCESKKGPMLKNYFIIALRNFKKYKIFSVLNIFGLALGISCIVFIYSFISYELSFEKCYPKADRLYRVTHTSIESSTTRFWAPTAPRVGPSLKEYMPEIESYGRVYQIYALTFTVKDSTSKLKKFTELNGFYADPSMLEMFDFEFISGNSINALNELQNVVISESMAEKFYPKESALGKTIYIDDYQQDFLITGVFKDNNATTHIKMNYLIPMELLRKYIIDGGNEDLYNALGWAGPYNYILLKENVDIAALEAKIPDWTVSYWEGNGSSEEILAQNKYPLQPIKKIHLHSKLEQEIGPNSDVTYVYVFATVALLILLIGGVNYVNISTAQSMRRIKEIGIRKVVGAYRSQIIKQYFSESLLITVLSGILAVLLIDLLYPYFNRFSGLEYNIAQFFSLENIGLIIGVVIVLGVLAGLYPALLASGFSIDDNIKGAKKVGSFSHHLRKMLVILQFAISVFLIFSTLVIFKQLKYFNEVDLGFTKENVVAIPNSPNLSRAMRNDYMAFKAEIQSNPKIIDISSTSNLPGERTSVESLFIEGHTPEAGDPSLRFIRTDENYLQTMKIDLIEGDGFIYNADTLPQFIINKSCKDVLGLDELIGRTATNIWGRSGRIVGVMDDFNFASLHESVEPLVIEYNAPGVNGRNIYRFKGDPREVITYLESKLLEYDPSFSMYYEYLTDTWNDLYETENKAGDTFSAFTLLAIIISCIGLFGLAAITSESRMKEMGIRKIHGASLVDITKAFGTSFIKLILIASLIAIPTGWLIIERWLQGFEYQIELSWVFIVYSLVFILLISFLTILYQIIKVHRANPIDYIKYE